MRKAIYDQAKLNIFESESIGSITKEQANTLRVMLEDAKEKSELTDAKIKDFFEELKEKYPNMSEDIDKFQEKLDKKGEEASDDNGDNAGDDSGDNSGNDSGDDSSADDKGNDDEAPAEESANSEGGISEACMDFLSRIESM